MGCTVPRMFLFFGGAILDANSRTKRALPFPIRVLCHKASRRLERNDRILFEDRTLCSLYGVSWQPSTTKHPCGMDPDRFRAKNRVKIAPEVASAQKRFAPRNLRVWVPDLSHRALLPMTAYDERGLEPRLAISPLCRFFWRGNWKRAEGELGGRSRVFFAGYWGRDPVNVGRVASYCTSAIFRICWELMAAA